MKYKIIIDSIAFLCWVFLVVSSYIDNGFGGLTGLCFLLAVCQSVDLIGNIRKYKKQKAAR